MVVRSFKIRSREDLINAADPQFLVEKILPERSLAVLIGSPGAGKTFLALGMSLCVCNNQSWLGYETRTGGVIYITSEGLNGLKLRLQAWESHHNIQVENFGYISDAPQFLSKDEVESLINGIKSSDLKNPALIVIDTLARHMVGGDENSAQHMGQFVANIDKLRGAFDCAIIVVHHTGKSNSKNSFSERGSSALRGAADTMILMAKNKSVISISCEKQKDCEPFEDIPIAMLQVELLNGNNSCVIIEGKINSVSSDKLDIAKEKILGALLSAKETSLRTKEIRDLTKIPESSYHRHKDHLKTHGFIIQDSQQRYLLTEKGEEYALTLKTLPNHSHESQSHTPNTPPPL
jgi:hypothetical protein